MKTELKKLKVKFEGKPIEIDIQKELSINENIINSQLRESPPYVHRLRLSASP